MCGGLAFAAFHVAYCLGTCPAEHDSPLAALHIAVCWPDLTVLHSVAVNSSLTPALVGRCFCNAWHDQRSFAANPKIVLLGTGAAGRYAPGRPRSCTLRCGGPSTSCLHGATQKASRPSLSVQLHTILDKTRKQDYGAPKLDGFTAAWYRWVSVFLYGLLPACWRHHVHQM